MSASRRVLVIDDDPQILQAVSLRVRALGHTVVTARDGEDGLTQVTKTIPDLIVTDIRMPRMDGLEFIRRLRHHTDGQSTPVIVISASAVDKASALAEGASYFLPKPYDPQMLSDAINRIVTSQ